MKLLQKLFSFFKRKRLFCEHPKQKDEFSIHVFGKEVILKKSPYCRQCTQEYLNNHSTVCAMCGDAILVGTPIGIAFENACNYNYSYVHMTNDCSMPGQFVGYWGEGRKVIPHDKPQTSEFNYE